MPEPVAIDPDPGVLYPALPPPPGAGKPRLIELTDDEWLTAMAGTETRVSVYLDSGGRQVRLVHPGLIPPAAITLHAGVPAAPVEFIWKGDD
jgi:hypothetical protein